MCWNFRGLGVRGWGWLEHFSKGIHRDAKNTSDIFCRHDAVVCGDKSTEFV